MFFFFDDTCFKQYLHCVFILNLTSGIVCFTLDTYIHYILREARQLKMNTQHKYHETQQCLKHVSSRRKTNPESHKTIIYKRFVSILICSASVDIDFLPLKKKVTQEQTGISKFHISLANHQKEHTNTPEGNKLLLI